MSFISRSSATLSRVLNRAPVERCFQRSSLPSKATTTSVPSSRPLSLVPVRRLSSATTTSTTSTSTSSPSNTHPRQESTSAPLHQAQPHAHPATDAHHHHHHKKVDPSHYATLSDEQLHQEIIDGKLKFFDLENQLGDMERAVRLRRGVVEQKVNQKLDKLPYQHFDYNIVHGQCAENVIGFVSIPVGVAGPLLVDGKEYHVPLATTEGALIASTTRGCKAISSSGGAVTSVLKDGITRAPVLQVSSSRVGAEIKDYVESHFNEVADAFNSTSRFARLQEVKVFLAGRFVYLRFLCSSGDAMGMNMVSKGVDKALDVIAHKFPVQILSLSGNVCTDKKPSAINWLEGRGKSVVCEAVIKGDIVESVLKTTVEAMVQLNYAKNLVGSAVAGSLGGFNAHSSNIVTAAFLATGQDPAQNVESSTCMTLMEPTNNGKDLYVSVNMPSLEVGTVGGGTILPGQGACLEMLGVKGSNADKPGENAKQLARVISATVMAGELSLMAALSAGHLIRSHLKLNRKPSTPHH